MRVLIKTFLVLLCVGLVISMALAQSRSKTRPSAPAEAAPQKAPALFEAGQDAHAAGKLEEAIRLYSQAIELDSSLWQAEFQRATAYHALRQLPAAQSSINKVLEALKEFADSPELKQITAKAQSLRGEIALVANQPAEAEQAFRRVLELDEKNQRALVGLAQILVKDGKFAEAGTTAKAAIAAGDDSAFIYALLGHAQSRNQQNDEAVANLSEALKREPNNVQALRDRAEIFIARKNTAQAIADLQALLATEKSTATMLRLALMQRLAQHYDEACKLYQQVIEAEPENQDARTALAEILIESGQAENAVAELEKLIKADPGRADLRTQLAVLLLVNQPDKAFEQYQAAAQLEPDNPKHKIGMGSALVKMRRFAEAIATLRPVLGQALNNDLTYTTRANLATAHFESDDYPNAVREYIWLLNYLSNKGDQKKLAITTYLLGICFDKLGDFEQALKAYQQFLALASAEQQLEIEKIKLRMPSLQRQIAQGKGIKRKQ